MDPNTKRISKDITCPHCDSIAKKEKMHLEFETFIDDARQRSERRPKRVPVLMNYTVGGRKYEKKLDSGDFERLERIASLGTPTAVPTAPLPDCKMARVGRMRTTNTGYVHHMFLPRAAHALSAMWLRANKCGDPRRAKHAPVFGRASHLGDVVAESL